MTKDVSKRVWDDSLELRDCSVPLHGECFTSSSLTIGEYCSIVTLQNIAHYGSSYSVININLDKIVVINDVLNFIIFTCFTSGAKTVSNVNVLAGVS